MKNRLIYVLTIVTIALYLIFLLVLGMQKSFYYGLDPAVVYVTNALLYTKSAIISYADHPGTPTIMLLYMSYVPLRFIAKYIVHLGFIDWSYINFSFLMFYSRLVELATFGVGIYFFLKSISSFIKTNVLVIISWLLLFVFIGFNWGVSIAPEALALPLTSIWLYVFSKYRNSNKYYLTIILSFIAGLAVANKFTAVFMAIASILLPLFDKNTGCGQKLLRLEMNIGVLVAAFYLGIMPAIMQFDYIKTWFLQLLLHTGVYGVGQNALFDLPSYTHSLGILLSANCVLFGLIFVTITIAVYLIIIKKLSISDPVVILLTSAVVGTMVFVKYPIIRYLFINFILIEYCFIYLLNRMKFKFGNILLVFILFIFCTGIWNYVDTTLSEINRNDKTVYIVLKEWTPFWALDIYHEQLNTTNQP